MALVYALRLFGLCVVAVSALSLSVSTLAKTLPPSDFAKDYEFLEPQLSPDGEHIAMIIVKDGKRRLAVVKTETLSSVGGADMGEDEQVGSFYWANNKRLVMEVWASQGWTESASNYGELFAVDLDGKRGDSIFGYRAGSTQTGRKIKAKESIRAWAEVLSLLPEDEDHILISSRPWSIDGRRQATVHRLNIEDGDISSVLTALPYDTTYALATDEGKMVVAVGLNKEYKRIIYVYEGNEYRELDASEFGRGFFPVAVDEKGHSLIYLDNGDTDKWSLYQLNLKTGEKSHIYTDEVVDISDVIVSEDGFSALAILIERDYPNYLIIDDKSKAGKLFEKFATTFQGYFINVTSSSEDGSKYIIHARSDTAPSQYFLYDDESKKFRMLFKNMSHIPRKMLSQSQAFSFEASDGQQIPAYITYPSHLPESQSVPLVVLVHGGPGARDNWTFDSEVQMLAAQGYAVLRINFRGSSGYGDAFELQRQGNWGTRVQQDIIDGTQFIINAGGILSDKVCIMGASFGGYSAVMSATIAPDLYTCVVANIGVYDLDLMYEEGNIAERLLYGPAYLKEELGTDPKVRQAQSPITHVSKLKAPIFLAHGALDEQVPIEHAERLKAELDKYNKSYVWLESPRAGHGFFEEESRTVYFTKVAEFLSQHLK